jgi:PAS domain S-box-containing protein
MGQILVFFKGLFAHDQWPARWHCGLWSPFHGWLYIISDLLIWSACFAIPLLIIHYIRTKKDVKFLSIYFLFAGFILACGLTHLLDAVTFWYPMYRLSAILRFCTGIISWVTVLYLIKMLPLDFSLSPAEHLEAEVERRKVVEDELRFRLAQLVVAHDICGMGYWEWHIASDKLDWSEGLLKVFGVATDDTLTYHFYMSSYVHTDDRAYVAEMMRELAAGKPSAVFYHRIVTPLGAVKTLQIRSESNRDKSGRVTTVKGTAQDVTDQKKSEHELISKTKELESMNTQLEQFAYTASHDLQEPLRKIALFGTMLNEEYKNVLDEKGQSYLEKVITGSTRMQTLIKDILSFSKLSSAHLSYEKCDLDSILSEVLSDMQVSIESGKVLIKSGKLPVIEANRVQIGQFLQNIISNSIKFSKAEHSPVIEIKAAMLTGDQLQDTGLIKSHYKFTEWNEDRYWRNESFVQIDISDSGIGFDPAYSEKIFQVFQRLNANKLVAGTGIGLAICKKIADNHHGIIRAVGIEGQGATFTIILPVSQANFKSAQTDTSLAQRYLSSPASAR